MRGVRTYKGIDCSGPNHVMAPTFEGVKSLVNRVGYAGAIAASAAEEDLESPEADILDDFLQDLRYCDKIERVQVVRDFRSYLNSLKPASSGSGAKGGTPVPSENKPNDTVDSLASDSSNPSPGQGAGADGSPSGT